MKSPILMGLATALAAASCTPTSHPMTDSELRHALEQRFVGDRTGACVAAAVIDRGLVSHARVCSDPRESRLDGTVALEIGSVSKTMTAALLASLAEEGKLGLDDPLSQHLPATARVPSFQGQPILLKHLVTHTSGLPSIPDGLALSNPQDPYAALTGDQLLEALSAVELTRAPGTAWEYSNFGVMLESWVVARATGTDLESALRARLFEPLGMHSSHVAQPPPGVRAAAGHVQSGEVTSPWHFPVDLAGVGGVRSTLDDMILYAQAHLGRADPATAAALRATHDAVDLGSPRRAGDPEMGMAWIRASLNGKTALLHEGETGGFSSIVAIVPEDDRAVIALSDTAIGNAGAMAEVAAYFLGTIAQMPGPREVTTPSAPLLQEMAGRYRVEGLEVELEARGDALVVHLPDGTELALGYDSRGDFYPLSEDALLTPTVGPSGERAFYWISDGPPALAARL